MSPDHAETIALNALSWIATDPERSGPFLAASGLDGAALAARAGEPDFLGFVLEHLLAMGDEAILSFCDTAGVAPEDVMAARAALPGGDLPNWT